MGRKTNYKAIIVAVIAIIVAFVVATIVMNVLPDSADKFKGLIFWVIVIIIGGVGTVVSAKNMNNTRRY